METYHRKRSRRTAINAIINVQEMMSLKRQETSSIVGGAQAQTLPLARQTLLQSNDMDQDEEPLESGSVYEIYHRNLPPRTPVQLRSTRVVMVSEKTDLNVAIRYPSIGSLRMFFRNRSSEMYPQFDERFLMGTKCAGKVLLRQVPSQEFAERKHLEDFWLVNPHSLIGLGDVITNKDDKAAGLVTELKNGGLVRWGVRRQVMFIGKHRDISKSRSSSSFVESDEVKGVDHEGDDDDEAVEEQNDGDDDEAVEEQNDGDDDEPDEEQNDGEEVEEEEEAGQVKNEEEVEDEEEGRDVEDEQTLPYRLKRKRKSTRNLRKRKQIKRENQGQTKKNKKKNKKSVFKDPTDRWSKERYMAAEQSLLEVMKEKRAVIGNPIMRPALRLEARKRIGDTGLLDHLLKHVANKVAPGGTLRFRRWHNADGAMEYWLEDADLLKIRKEAGVSDPFWTPPPGWKLGDSPIQDPMMAKELAILKEELSSLKRGMEVSKKQHEEEMAKLRRVMEVSKKQHEEEMAKPRRDMELSEKQHEEEMAAKLRRGMEEFKKHCEEEMAKLRREIEGLISKNKQDGSPPTVVSSTADTSPKQLNLSNSLVPLVSDLHSEVVQKENCKEEMQAISHKKIKVRMQGNVGKDKTKMEGKTKAGTELITTTESRSAEKEPEKAQETEKSKAAAVALQKEEVVVVEPQAQPQPPPLPSSEGKAAKIERLKSGFRICKPQGTFLWPNMVNKPTPSSDSNMLSSQVEDLLVVPTPPSVNSSTSTQLMTHHHHPASPVVRPVPERRAVTVTVSTVSEGPPLSYEHGGSKCSSTATSSNSNRTVGLINLNDMPPRADQAYC